MTRALALLCAAASLAGCLDAVQGEGEERLIVRNHDIQPLELILRVAQVEGDITLLAEDVVLEMGASKEYALAMRPGRHSFAITTSTGLHETLYVDIPSRGDSDLELRLLRGRATLTQN